ncbi:hypothetical protein J1N35_005120 [Gossypium stocksii]|uniref:RNase H type-1 domain-containing protein n=1 Tax=Gossypium stocksii TaxID=47602 RepID=A0A9D3WEN3_9ROSI|nr:hypothetical protein J1N35_005120 [Gossypium stocksii]
MDAILNGCSGFGIIARDHDGFVMGGCYSFIDELMDVTWEKMDAFREGIKLAEKLKVTKLILESDSAWVVNAVNKKGNDITWASALIRIDCRF